MDDVTLLAAVKSDLGITHTKKDADLAAAILSAKKRLRMIGVVVLEDDDPLTRQAVKLYCRAWLNFQGDADRYSAAFEALADAMALSGDYGGCSHE